MVCVGRGTRRRVAIARVTRPAPQLPSAAFSANAARGAQSENGEFFSHGMGCGSKWTPRGAAPLVATAPTVWAAPYAKIVHRSPEWVRGGGAQYHSAAGKTTPFRPARWPSSRFLKLSRFELGQIGKLLAQLETHTLRSFCVSNQSRSHQPTARKWNTRRD